VAEEKVTRTEEMTQKEHSKCCKRKDIRGEEGRREMVGGEREWGPQTDRADEPNNSIDDERNPEESRGK
jgi:hypothetical protein